MAEGVRGDDGLLRNVEEERFMLRSVPEVVEEGRGSPRGGVYLDPRGGVYLDVASRMPAERVPMRSDLLVLFDLAELEKYYTAAELTQPLVWLGRTISRRNG